MKIGRYILAAIVAVVAAKNVGVQEKSFSPSCNAEYIDAKVINQTTTLQLPNTLTTYEGCTIRVSFNSGARQDYFAFEPEERQTFTIKARRSGDFVNVYQVSRDGPSDVRVLRTALNRDIFHTDGYGDGKCFNAYYEKLCFKDKDAVPYLSRSRVILYDLTVDTAGNITHIKPVQQ